MLKCSSMGPATSPDVQVSQKHAHKADPFTMKAPKCTPVEKASLKLQRKARSDAYSEALAEAREVVLQQAAHMQEQFGTHDISYYLKTIMQQARMVSKQRKVNRWNIFLSQEVKKHNNGLPSNERRVRTSDPEVAKEISAHWKVMSKEEHEALMEDGVKNMANHRKMRAFVPHNTLLSAYHDAHVTLNDVEHELTVLNSCTDMDVLLFTVRSNAQHYNKPYIFCSNHHLAEFVKLVTKASVQELALKMEGYCISGIFLTTI
ncbi:hypothetical protein A0H81_07734 [Grifola frondosa]|uniref:Uncharacterized protein n=1 Tax=Grifola frondosa TaxID=5627 RepID=A0A1C7M7H6_GRIFR|nr:hypothetical protein A0H81_07734 [Grifola frondosa]